MEKIVTNRELSRLDPLRRLGARKSVEIGKGLNKLNAIARITKGTGPDPAHPLNAVDYFMTALMSFRASSALSKAPTWTQTILPDLSRTAVTG